MFDLIFSDQRSRLESWYQRPNCTIYQFLLTFWMPMWWRWQAKLVQVKLPIRMKTKSAIKYLSLFEDSIIKERNFCDLGFQISLQAQSVIYLESFHEGKKSELSDMLEKENWKKLSQSNSNNSGPVLVSSKQEKFLQVPYLHSIIFSMEKSLTNVRNPRFFIFYFNHTNYTSMQNFFCFIN